MVNQGLVIVTVTRAWNPGNPWKPWHSAWWLSPG